MSVSAIKAAPAAPLARPVPGSALGRPPGTGAPRRAPGPGPIQLIPKRHWLVEPIFLGSHCPASLLAFVLPLGCDPSWPGVAMLGGFGRKDPGPCTHEQEWGAKVTAFMTPLEAVP